MFPKLISIKIPEWLQWLLPAELTVYSYGVMIALGILVSFIVALRRAKKFGVDSDQLSSLFIWVVLASFIGGKLFFYFENPQKYFSDPTSMLDASGGGFVFYGSLLFAIPTIFWWLRSKKIPIRPFFDILAIVGPIVHSFGRVGCFLAGCCHGKACDNILGVTYSHPDSLADPLNVALHPTQLYDIAVNLIVLIVVLSLEKKKKFEGQLFLVYLMIYAVGRTIVELFRGDEARGYVIENVLSHSQFIAILIIAGSLYFWKKWVKELKD